MHTLMLGRGSWTWFVAVIVVAVIASATIVSGDGGDPGTVHACLNVADGNVRIVDPSTTCRKNETAAHWPAASRVVALESAVSTLQSQIALLEVTDAAQNRQLGGLTAQVSALQSEVATLTSENSAQDAQIAGLQSSVASLQGAASTLQGQVAGILSTETTQNAAIVTLQSQVATLSATTYTAEAYEKGLVNFASVQLLTLFVPAGKYVLIGKGTIRFVGASGTATCELVGDHTDQVYIDLPATVDYPFSLAMVTQQGGGVTLRCGVSAQNVSSVTVSLPKLIAIPVQQVQLVNQ